MMGKHMATGDTIVAQASAQGAARRGIIRLSGNDVLNAVAPIFFRRAPSDAFPPETLQSRKVTANAIFEDSTKTGIVSGWLTPWGANEPDLLVPCALFYWPQERGFTGERAVELHLPGSPSVINAAVRTICKTRHARLATRGEFTLRAFLSGRIDLTQAEAVLGAIDASSDAELQNALLQLSGSLSRDFAALREKLFNVLCDLEAGFDFVDEDIEFVTRDEIRTQLRETIAQVEETLKRAKTRIGADQTPRVALVGSPNVGKSSLFNKTIEFFGDGNTGKAIVSDIAGATRDYLEKEINVDGVRFILVDSAGVENEEAFAKEATEENAPSPRILAQRGLKQLFANASVVVRCVDSTAQEKPSYSLIDKLIPATASVLHVATKQDLLENNNVFGQDVVVTSASTGFGIDMLGTKIAETLRKDSENGEIVPSTAIRCQEALREAKEALQNALDLLDDESIYDDFILASEIRVALDRIGIVTGQVHTDDLLDRIFSRFCIGK